MNPEQRDYATRNERSGEERGPEEAGQLVNTIVPDRLSVRLPIWTDVLLNGFRIFTCGGSRFLLKLSPPNGYRFEPLAQQAGAAKSVLQFAAGFLFVITG